jgi:hypothetical protein
MKLSLKLPARFAPRKPRAAIEIASSLLLPDDCVMPVVIKNISPDGFMALCASAMAADTWVGVAIPGRGILPAVIRWSNADGEFGAQFRRPLDLERVLQETSAEADGRALFSVRILQGPF